MRRILETIFVTVKVLAISAALTSAGAQQVTIAEGYTVTPDPSVTGDYKFAHGFGLIYAPMQITRTLGVLEKKYPNAKIEWQNIFTTGQQRDAMLAGRLHFGSCTPGPYLQSWDKGVDWKWVQVTSGFDGYLMVRPDGPKDIIEFIGTAKKLSPGPATAQYFTAQELLHRAGKDVKALDRNFVNLPHPDAMQALIAGQLDGHWATADFAMRLVDQGMRKIASFRETFNALYAVGSCSLTKTVNDHPAITRGYAETLRQTAAWMKANPQLAAEAMSKSVDNKVSSADFAKYMKSDIYDTYVTDADLQGQAKSMLAIGVIKRKPSGPADFYAFPDEAGAKW